jgi:hypothetical protein
MKDTVAFKHLQEYLSISVGCNRALQSAKRWV